MNKPAPKEPSMDEILSSIRQIIADDDAAVTPPQAAAPKPATPGPAVSALQTKAPAAAPVPRSFGSVASAPAQAAPKQPEPGPEPEPLALTPEQILRDEAQEMAGAEADDFANKPAGEASFADAAFAMANAFAKPSEAAKTDNPGKADDFTARADVMADDEDDEPPTLVDPEDITFDEDDAVPDPEPLAPTPEPAPAPPRMSFSALRERPATPPTPAPAARKPPESPQSPPPPRPAANVSGAAPMPDPTLSSDMAEQLLEPATNAAVKQAFTRLNGMSTVSPGVTLEAMMREMLRPMLKEWLDEHLPSVVERMVEKEIARISRGE